MDNSTSFYIPNLVSVLALRAWYAYTYGYMLRKNLEIFETPRGEFWSYKSILIRPYVIFDIDSDSAFELWAWYRSLGLITGLMICNKTFWSHLRWTDAWVFHRDTTENIIDNYAYLR